MKKKKVTKNLHRMPSAGVGSQRALLILGQMWFHACRKEFPGHQDEIFQQKLKEEKISHDIFNTAKHKLLELLSYLNRNPEKGQHIDSFVCFRNICSFTIWSVSLFPVISRSLLAYSIEEVHHCVTFVFSHMFTKKKLRIQFFSFSRMICSKDWFPIAQWRNQLTFNWFLKFRPVSSISGSIELITLIKRLYLDLCKKMKQADVF